ncbi:MULTISPECIES: hypothetical protein [Aeromonas]|uniref:hypothetical protein n=1 Tax=Aeromonas sp. YN13HZO-058 TaxID=1921564 RepID=UPI0011D10E0A|nr:hypothetical protein [Aeromonas sp. YN13HZO-058]
MIWIRFLLIPVFDSSFTLLLPARLRSSLCARQPVPVSDTVQGGQTQWSRGESEGEEGAKVSQICLTELFLLFEECDQGHIFGFCIPTMEKTILDISVPPGRTIFVHLGGFLAVYPPTWLINESFVAMNDDYFCR